MTDMDDRNDKAAAAGESAARPRISLQASLALIGLLSLGLWALVFLLI